MTKLVLFSGSCLVLGGVLVALLNLILTPMLPIDEGSIAVSTSAALGIRLPLAALTVVLTTLGCVGLYLAHADRLRVGALAFLVAGVGGMMMFFAETVQFTLVRDLAFEVPETWEALESAGALGRYDLAFAIAVATYALGWLAIAVVTLRAGVLGRRGPYVLLAGVLLAPILGGFGGILGAAAGSVILGAGWALLGLDLRHSAAAG